MEARPGGEAVRDAHGDHPVSNVLNFWALAALLAAQLLSLRSALRPRDQVGSRDV